MFFIWTSKCRHKDLYFLILNCFHRHCGVESFRFLKKRQGWSLFLGEVVGAEEGTGSNALLRSFSVFNNAFMHPEALSGNTVLIHEMYAFPRQLPWHILCSDFYDCCQISIIPLNRYPRIYRVSKLIIFFADLKLSTNEVIWVVECLRVILRWKRYILADLSS